MAGSSGDNQVPEQQPKPSSPPSQPKTWHEEENPFVAFRRYADEQISSMLQSVMGLPSTITQPTADHWVVFADDSNYKNHTRQRRAGETDNAGTDSGREDGSSTSKNYESDYDRSSASKCPRWSRRSDYDDIDRWRWHTHRARPFDFFGIDSFFDKPWSDDRFPFPFGLFNPFSDAFEEAELGAWPIPYLLFSPYSPLHLERQSRLRANRDKGVFSSLVSSLNLSSEEENPKEPRWRDAFEDLLRLENGKSMLNRDSQSLGKKETGSTWLRGLVERGSLGDRWKYLPTPNGNGSSEILYEDQSQEENKNNKPALSSPESNEKVQKDFEKVEPADELELYDRFLRDIEAREKEYFREFSQSPLLRRLHQDRQRYRDEIEERRRRLERLSKEEGSQDNESWLDLVSGGNKHSVPETRNEIAVATSVEQDTTAGSKESPSSVVVATMTSTERRTLADGTIQTKTIKTKRFSDGREERDESVEVLNSPQQKSENGDSQSSDKSSKGGWFWKE